MTELGDRAPWTEARFKKDAHYGVGLTVGVLAAQRGGLVSGVSGWFSCAAKGEEAHTDNTIEQVLKRPLRMSAVCSPPTVWRPAYDTLALVSVHALRLS